MNFKEMKKMTLLNILGLSKLDHKCACTILNKNQRTFKQKERSKLTVYM